MEQAGDYCPAAVCERGHTATSKADYREPPSRCATCGARVLIACPHCKYRIQGAKIGVGGRPYSPPDFCDGCGEPFPWLSRAGRVNLLQNLLDGEELDEASRLEVREELDALARSDGPADEQLRR
jgi:hypothetical protein